MRDFLFEKRLKKFKNFMKWSKSMLEKKYILITGTGFVNKGSQAMLFTAIDELKKRFPNQEIIDLSTLDFNKADVNQYNFRILPDNLSLFIPKRYSFIRDIGKFFLRYNAKRLNNKEQVQWVKKMRDIYANTYFIVNAGGFALGAPIGRGKSETSMAFLMRIMAADNLNIPIYLLPQSFGPFNYKFGHRQLVNYFMKRYLHKAKLVFAREVEGAEFLKPYKQEGLILCRDIVITNQKTDENNIYTNPTKSIRKISIKGHSPVAIIPNMMCFENMNREKFVEMYKLIIKQLQINHDIYILRHSKEDLEACLLIYDNLINTDRVYKLTDDFNCFELDYILGQFEFCVASRFHSIIHSYKNYTPCVVICWAVKYYDLLQSFKQKKYLFDVREGVDLDKVIEKIEEMERNYIMEKIVIQKSLEQQQNFNAFDIIETDIKNA